jgi:hypothetical protein
VALAPAHAWLEAIVCFGGLEPAIEFADALAVAEFSEPGFRQIVREFGGSVTHRKTADEVRQSNGTIFEFTWNHNSMSISSKTASKAR